MARLKCFVQSSVHCSSFGVQLIGIHEKVIFPNVNKTLFKQTLEIDLNLNKISTSVSDLNRIDTPKSVFKIHSSEISMLFNDLLMLLT